MASQTEIRNLFERFLWLRYRDSPLFMSFLTIQRRNPQDPDQQVAQVATINMHDRITLINPFTQGMQIIEGETSSLDSLLREPTGKDGQPPASQASIDAMPCFEITEGGDGSGECVICLEEWELGGVVKEMPCEHRFHAECIVKWLGIHGSCPVCRYKMPVKEKVGQEVGGERRFGRDNYVIYSSDD